MSTKEKLLQYLEVHRGLEVSGEALAALLGVSRNAVWKAVSTLRAEGHLIEASPKKGYTLRGDSDVLTPQSVAKYLRSDSFYRLSVIESVDSTNNAVKNLALSGEPEGFVLIANAQTSGKGRRGRVFYSPGGSGLYLSLLLRPKLPASDALFITVAAAAATAEALEQVTGKCMEIKWVNDICFTGLKLCGILTEAALDLESGELSYAVLGIGVNISDPPGGFPQELQGIAASLFGGGDCAADTKSRLTAEILNRFADYYRALPSRPFMDEYRRRSCVVGREIEVLRPDRTELAFALGIDDDARLIVRFDSGATESLSSGEISIRRVAGSGRKA